MEGQDPRETTFLNISSKQLKIKNLKILLQLSSVSVVSDSLQAHGLQHARLQLITIPVHHQLLEPAQTHVYRISDAIQISHPLSSLSPPAFNLSQRRESFPALHIRWPKNWCFSFSISPSNEYSGLISFRIDWSDLL